MSQWRGGQVTRIEALTDAVFGFAITLLFVSFEVPKTFEGLTDLMSGFVVFAACFALIILVWYYHYKLFARFDMDDAYTIFLNALLLFVVLFFVYPLKFVFSAFFSFFLHTEVKLSHPQTQLPWVMAMYGVAYVTVFVVFSLMYLHAFRSCKRLGLGREDAEYAIEHLGVCLVMCAVGVISIILAFSVPWYRSGLVAGCAYGLIGPAQYLFGKYFSRRLQNRLIPSAPAV